MEESQILCGCTARFVLDLVGNPEDRFYQNEAHIYSGKTVPHGHLLSLSRAKALWVLAKESICFQSDNTFCWTVDRVDLSRS